MKKLFNNPKFVIGLSIAAFCYLAYSIVMPFLSSNAVEHSDDEFAQSIDIIDSVQNDINSTVDLSTYRRVDREKIDWLNQPDRDPFNTEVVLVEESTSSSTVVDKPTTNRSGTASIEKDIPLPKLSALFHRPNQSLAVLDGLLLKAGGSVSGFKVKSIDKYEVVVERAGKRYVLVPDRGS
ncbi:MAG: hypothetical protein KTR35_23335 [Gammaproteobacteria bacterium]|nr:hypothetical protein [Gammaproteobacteria bacterium]